MSPAHKVVITLTAEQRAALGRLVRTGTHPAAMVRRAQVLLKADADGPDAWTDEEIAEHLETTRMTVMRVRQQFAAEGLDATLHGKRPTGRQYRKLDGEQEAKLVTLACSKAPEGHARWTMKLLAERLVELEWWRASTRLPSGGRSKKRPQAVAEAAVGHPGGAGRGVRRGDGGRARGVPPPLRPGPPGGVRRRGRQATRRGHPRAAAGAGRQPGEGGLRV